MMKKLFFAAGLILAAVASTAAELRTKSFQLTSNMLAPASLPLMEKVIDRAAAAGYNTVFLGDHKFARFYSYGPEYEANVKRIVAYCRNKKLRVIAKVAAVGDGSPYLAADVNRAEGAPTVGADYVVRGGKLVPATENYLKNGDFKSGLKHWNAPDADVIVDSGVLRLRQLGGRALCAGSGRKSGWLLSANTD